MFNEELQERIKVISVQKDFEKFPTDVKLLFGALYFEYLNLINPFVPNAPFLFPVKTSENLKVFWRFQGVEKLCIGNKWVNYSLATILIYEAPTVRNTKKKFSIKDFLIWIWSHLLKKSLMENFIFLQWWKELFAGVVKINCKENFALSSKG